MLLLLYARISLFPGFYDVDPTCQLFHVLCTTQFWWGKKAAQKSHSKRLPQPTPVTSYYYYCYYCAAWSLAKKTILRLWLERTERRTESEGKEWVSAFPGGEKTWGMRGETEQKWEESWGAGQAGPRLSFRKCSLLNVKYGCCRFGHTFELGFILIKKPRGIQPRPRLCCLLHIRPQKSDSYSS